MTVLHVITFDELGARRPIATSGGTLDRLAWDLGQSAIGFHIHEVPDSQRAEGDRTITELLPHSHPNSGWHPFAHADEDGA